MSHALICHFILFKLARLTLYQAGPAPL